jgi:hypothetical protein
MAEYRFYVLNANGGVDRQDDVVAENDDRALYFARLRQAKAKIEVWCGRRWVGLVATGTFPVPAGET